MPDPIIVNLFEGEPKQGYMRFRIIPCEDTIFIEQQDYDKGDWERLDEPLYGFEKKRAAQLLTALAASIGKKVLVLDDWEYFKYIKLLRHCQNFLKLEQDIALCEEFKSKLTALRDGSET